jgi:hypothetical protein
MRAFVVLAGLWAGTSLAWGADLPSAPAPTAPAVYMPAAPPVYNWTGFYIGANGGWGFVNVTDTATFTGGLLGGLSGSGTATTNAAVAGGQIGYNYQINAAVPRNGGRLRLVRNIEHINRWHSQRDRKDAVDRNNPRQGWVRR